MKTKKVIEGKAKKVYETENTEQLVHVFKDDVLIKGKKQGTVSNKGAINNQISCYIFRILESYHVPTHFIKQLSSKEMLVKKLDMLPIEVLVRNIASGNLVERFSVEEGKELECPIIEYYMKNDQAEESLINEDHIVSFGRASSEEIKEIHRLSSKINAILKDFFRRRELKLVDIKLEFGKKENRLYVGDEISIDTCHFWDLGSGDRLVSSDNISDAKKAAQEYKDIKNRIFMGND